MDGLTFLEKAAKSKPQSVYVLHGDEDFLKRQVLLALQDLLLGDADPEFAVTSFAGDKAEFTAVRNELDTLPFLSPRRLVVIEQADPFITRYRATLEKWVQANPSKGVLILDVKTWASNTKLAKLVPETGSISCKAPSESKLPTWCADWARTRHQKHLPGAAAQLLIDLVGTAMGQLDQEIAKLSVYVGDRPAITAADVDQLVGKTRSQSVFGIIEAIGQNEPAQALHVLFRQFEEGQEPLAILGALSSQLRRLAQIARLNRQGASLAAAMDQAGVPAFPLARRNSEQQLRHLGLRRLEKLYDWLLEADLGMKGASPLTPRLILERLIVQLARPR